MTPDLKRVLNISKHDAIGRRFNNLDAATHLAAHGWKSRNCSWSEPEGADGHSVRANGRFNRITTKFLGEIATLTGNLNGFYRNAESIQALPAYREADLLHYHVVHEKWLSLHDLKALGQTKPVIWTWHDPYMITGHCVYPVDCDRFESGCIVCPHLDYHFPIMRDRAHKNLAEKVAAVHALDPLVLVASDYMRDMVRRSVYGEDLRVKTLPFGITFEEPASLDAAKQKLAIDPGRIVLGFRAAHSTFKGSKLAIEATLKLANEYPNLPLTVIAFQEQGMCAELSRCMQVMEVGWINDADIQDYYAAMDIFMMPSKVEAFGLMAIEAMAAGAFPIVTNGTALPQLIDAPVHGIAVDYETEALYGALFAVVLDLDKIRGQRATRVNFARTRYGIENFCLELAEVYDQEIEYRAHN